MTVEAKGGALAKLAGIWCREPGFWDFLMHRTGEPVYSESTAAAVVRKLCDVNSRAELDSVPKAEAHFHVRVRLPYMRWMQGARECRS